MSRSVQCGLHSQHIRQPLHPYSTKYWWRITKPGTHTHVYSFPLALFFCFRCLFIILYYIILYFILCYFCLVCQVGEMALPSFQCLGMAISDFTNDAFQ
jgi:hypothetical protein